jgi:hypothetical protein
MERDLDEFILWDICVTKRRPRDKHLIVERNIDPPLFLRNV